MGLYNVGEIFSCKFNITIFKLYVCTSTVQTFRYSERALVLYSEQALTSPVLCVYRAKLAGIM